MVAVQGVMEQPMAAVDRSLGLALYSLYVDKITVAITRVLADHGIDCILLKGPAIARWLYQDGSPRPYGDADLMVAPGDWQATQRVLSDLGFCKELGALDHPGMESIASEAWVRGPDNVDLHCTLWGMGANPSSVWSALSADTETLEIEGHVLRVLPPAARALLLATHAAKHGDGWAVNDLERGLDMLDGDLWRRAAHLAAELGATSAFVSGLLMVSGGRDLVRSLGLSETPMPEAELRAWRVPLTLGLEHLASTSGWRSKLGIIVRELCPTPAFLRWWTPIARRGLPGLIAAYVWRLLWICRHAVPAWLAWRQVHRPAGS